VKLPRRLLISGLPGAGKSFFVDWLAETRGFAVLKADDGGVAFRRLWRVARSGNAGLVRMWLLPSVLRRLVLEVGFPPEPEIVAVRTLVAAGFSAWWFTAEPADAFRGWRQAWPGTDRGAFDHQVERIATNWSTIQNLFPGHVIQTVRDGKRMSPEEIGSVITKG
jgi:hypothetical protein